MKLLMLFLDSNKLNHGSTGHGRPYWPLIHVTHPDFLTHLIHDPLTALYHINGQCFRFMRPVGLRTTNVQDGGKQLYRKQ